MKATHPWPAQLMDRVTGVSGALVVFVHQGVVDPAVQQRLLGEAERHSLDQGDAVGLRKRLFSVLVEGLENILRHTPPALAEASFAMLTDTGGGYTLLLGNPMPRATAELVQQRLGILNEMDEVALKEHYLRLLANTERTALGGAGLGLFTMARKCGRPMLTHTSPIDDHLVHFALDLRLPR